MTGEPVLTVLLLGTIAAGCGALGALPFAWAKVPTARWIGGAGGVASGLMLGAGYLLMSRALDRSTAPVVAGAAIGVVYTYWIQSYAGLGDLDRSHPEAGGVEYGYKVVLQNTLHASAEGIAIGVAMVLDLRLGIFIALALAVHNIAESMALTDILRHRGASVGHAAGLGVVSNLGQPLLALAAFALSPVLGGFLSVALGYSAGCLVFLVLTELLPASYGKASNRWIGFLVSLSAGAMVLLEHYFVHSG